MTDVLERARAWGEQHYPDASPQKHAAFANSVQYVLTGMSGGYGGPSIREHAVSAALNDTDPHPGTPERAYTFVASIVYGPLTRLHHRLYEDMQPLCFDDDPQDVHELARYRAN